MTTISRKMIATLACATACAVATPATVMPLATAQTATQDATRPAIAQEQQAKLVSNSFSFTQNATVVQVMLPQAALGKELGIYVGDDFDPAKMAAVANPAAQFLLGAKKQEPTSTVTTPEPVPVVLTNGAIPAGQTSRVVFYDVTSKQQVAAVDVIGQLGGSLSKDLLGSTDVTLTLRNVAAGTTITKLAFGTVTVKEEKMTLTADDIDKASAKLTGLSIPNNEAALGVQLSVTYEVNGQTFTGQLTNVFAAKDATATSAEYESQTVVAARDAYHSTYDPMKKEIFLVSAYRRDKNVPGEIKVIDAMTLKEKRKVVTGKDKDVRSGFAAVVDPETNNLWVSNTRDDSVQLLDATTLKVKKTYEDVGHTFTLALDPTTHFAYVTNPRDSMLAVLDPAKDEAERLSLAGGATLGDRDFGSMQFTIADGKGYAAYRNTAKIAVMDLKTKQTEFHDLQGAAITEGKILPSSSAAGIAYNPASKTVWVAFQNSNNVAEIDPTSGEVLHVINTGEGPVFTAVDAAAGRVYVTNRTSRSVTVIDAKTAGVIANLSTGDGYANGVTVIESGTVLVASRLADAASSKDLTAQDMFYQFTAKMPAGETKPADEAKPKDEAKPADEAKPMDEAKPAEEAKGMSKLKLALIVLGVLAVLGLAAAAAAPMLGLPPVLPY